ncbi:MAG TPA: MMPL family transporter [Acidimicrobiales bacterium]|nr:MMPL family transporter [Acidimicrobiales bacterium]
MVVAWLAGLVFVAGTANAFGGELANTFEAPASESQRAFDLLFERFPEQAGAGAEIVFRADATVDDPAVAGRMQGLFAEIEAQERIADVVSPYEPEGGFQVSGDRRVAFARIRFDVTTLDLPIETVRAVLDAVEAIDVEGLQVEVGGQAVQFGAREQGSREGIGLLAAVIVLLWTFGSVVAMGLPLATALLGLGVSVLAVPLVSTVIDVPIFGPSLALMIGLGVGIDYALFILTRFRACLHGGVSSEDACATALTTSGRAVLFAGMTVCISMMGLFVMGISFVQGMAVCAIVAVLLTMLASVTLLPALLGFAGPAVDRLAIPGLGRRDEHDRASAWFRWSRFIQRHPWPAALGALTVLLLLASPVVSMRLGSADAGSNPKGSTTREAYDLITEGFGPGFNGPLLVAAEVRGMEDLAALERVAVAARETDGVVFAPPPQVNRAADAAIVLVIPESAPQAIETEQLIDRLRHEVVPTALAGHDLVVNIGGVTAMYSDLSHILAKRLPLFMAAVIGLSFLLLLVVFRSVLVPIKAAVMNLLSIGASYGVIVAVFQWGWLSDLVGIDRTGPIQSFAPMMLFAILFGLSMDYEVFLISRMREEYLRTGNNAVAVADGLAATARVITAAAAIMITVFASFVFNADTILKLFGLGLATAILMDATIVRTVLVPATMELLGDRNWWFPAWLDRLVPRVSVEAAEPSSTPIAMAPAGR